MLADMSCGREWTLVSQSAEPVWKKNPHRFDLCYTKRDAYESVAMGCRVKSAGTTLMDMLSKCK